MASADAKPHTSLQPLSLPAPPRARDAWFVIRGYVYQVETTIDRWLGLRDNEHLELERGEDIDTVSRWSNSSDDESRLLEQVKHLDRSITLNSPEARAALANFLEHRDEHATPANVRFRFLTTAPVAREREPSMGRGLTGIETWSALRSRATVDRATLVQAAALRRILRAGTKAAPPPGVPQQTWEGYAAHLRRLDLAGLLQIVDAFEWSTSNPTLAGEADRIREVLVELGYATTRAAAESLHDRLFAAVFQTLCAPGVKRLTVSGRDALLRQSPRSRTATPAVARLRSVFLRLQAEVAELAERVDEHDLALTDLKTAMQSLADSRGVHAGVAFVLDDRGTGIPPSRAPRSTRAGTVAELDELLTRLCWVGISGTSGSGKTELAILLAERRTQSARWISARDTNVRETVYRIRQSLLGANAQVATSNRVDAYAAIAVALGARPLVVVDDIPILDADDVLGRELVALALGLARSNGNLLTTSASPLPDRIVGRLRGTTQRRTAPSFSAVEIQEFFAAHGAPASWLTGERIALVLSVTDGHAELVATAAAYLQNQSWSQSDTEIRALLNHDFSADLQRTVMRRLHGTVTSASARELLFRCSIAIGEFTTADVRAAAEIAPPIDGTTACLSALEGLWIQAASTGSLTVCPSAKPFAAELSAATARQIHRVFGDRLVGRERIGPIGLRHALAHYVAAAEYDRALLTWSFALIELGGEGGERFDDAGILDLWGAEPLPTQGEVGIRVYVRSLQVEALQRRGRTNEFILRDLLALALEARVSTPWALSIVLPRAPLLSRADFRATTEVVFAAALGPSKFEIGGHEVDLSDTPLKNFVWHQAANARDFEEVKIWLARLSEVPTDQRLQIAHGLDFELGCMGLCSRIWTREAEKPERERDWPHVLHQLHTIGEEGARLELPLLTALADYARATVIADYPRDVDAAVRICTSALAQTGDPRGTILLGEAAGRILTNAGRGLEAIPHLESSLNSATESFPLIRLAATRWLSRAEAARDPARAIQLADSAISFGRTIAFLPRATLAKVIADAAILQFTLHGVDAAWTLFEEAARELYDAQEDRDEWRDAAVVVAHVAGYFVSMASRGRPPDPIPRADGTLEPVADLTVGMFLSFSAERVARFAPSFAYQTAVMLTRLADWYESDELAVAWAERGSRILAASGGDSASQVLLDLVRLVDIGSRGSADETLRMALAYPSQDALSWGVLVVVVVLLRRRLDQGISAQLRQVVEALLVQLATLPPARNGQIATRIVAAAITPTSESIDWLLGRFVDTTLDLSVRAAARVVASAHPDRPVEGAFEDHLNVAALLSGPRAHPVYTFVRRLLGPFMFAFWEAALNRRAFLFRSPDALRAQLPAAATNRVPRRVPALLSVIASGLRVNLPEEAREWLRGG